MGFFAVLIIVISLFKEFWVFFNPGKYLQYAELFSESKNKPAKEKTKEEREAHAAIMRLSLLAIPATIVLVMLLFHDQFRIPAAAVLVLSFFNVGTDSIMPKLFKPAHCMIDAVATIALYMWMLHTALFI